MNGGGSDVNASQFGGPGAGAGAGGFGGFPGFS